MRCVLPRPTWLAIVKVKSKLLIGRSRSIQIHCCAWHCRGWVYRIAGLPEEAIRSFERAIRMSPIDPLLHLTFAGMGYRLYRASSL